MRRRSRIVLAVALALGFAAETTAANRGTITDVEVTPRVNRTKGTHYLSVKFVFNVDSYITSKKSLQVNAHCTAGGRTLRADTFAGISVRGLSKGDAKDGSALLFMSDRVRDEIEACRLRFELHEMGRKYGDKSLGIFCYRGGRVSEGACD
jgi:hypothetical protein